MAIEDINKMTAPLSQGETIPGPVGNGIGKGTMELAGGLDADDMMDRAYQWYNKNHLEGVKGFESPLYDEDGIPLIDPSIIFTMFMSA